MADEEPLVAPAGLDRLSRDDLLRAMGDNPHMGCPDAGCGPACPARIYDEPDGCTLNGCH